MPAGFVDRYKGKGFQPTGWLQQFGGGGANTQGGGQINSTGGVTVSSLGAASSSLASSGAEGLLMSYVLPAKSFDRLGRNLFIQAYGLFSTVSLTARTAKLYFGSETVSVSAGSSGAALAAASGWYLSMSVFAQSSASSAAAIQSMVTQAIGSTIGHQGVTVLSGNENVVANSTIKVTGFSSTPSTSGDVVALSLQVEGLN